LATVGLGQKYGNGVLFFANLFAIFSMSTGFMGCGTALRQSLTWDNKIPAVLSGVLVIFVPFLLFMAGIRSFVAILDTVGGVFVGVEAILMVLVYWRAKHKGDLPTPNYDLHHMWLFAVPVLLAFTVATIYGVVRMIR
jgi:hypothetical protein